MFLVKVVDSEMSRIVYPLLTVLDFYHRGQHADRVIVIEVTQKGTPIVVPYQRYNPEITRQNLKRPSSKYGLEVKIMHWCSSQGGWSVYGDLTKICLDQTLPSTVGSNPHPIIDIIPDN